MDSNPKESYRMAKILKKLTGLKFLKSAQSADISDSGKGKSRKYQQKKITKKSSKSSPGKKIPLHRHEDRFVRYQKELEAAKMMGSEFKPKNPGRIPKLRTGRKDIMSKTEE